eukprot:9990312-Prorocentrum_lima.AAC.1
MLRSWPFLLARVGEPGIIGDDEVLKVFEELCAEDECCLDPGFASKLRDFRAGPKDFAGDAA